MWLMHIIKGPIGPRRISIFPSLTWPKASPSLEQPYGNSTGSTSPSQERNVNTMIHEENHPLAYCSP